MPHPRKRRGRGGGTSAGAFCHVNHHRLEIQIFDQNRGFKKSAPALTPMVCGHWFQYAMTLDPAATVADSWALPRLAPLVLHARLLLVGLVIGS